MRSTSSCPGSGTNRLRVWSRMRILGAVASGGYGERRFSPPERVKVGAGVGEAVVASSLVRAVRSPSSRGCGERGESAGPSSVFRTVPRMNSDLRF